MRILSGKEEKNAKSYMQIAAELAAKATCNRSKCGSVIVNNNIIIGTGFNSPPANYESQRRCGNEKSQYSQKVTDKTCCIHAEQRAIMDALKTNPSLIKGSALYFIRLDSGNKISFAGKPYCTICSKMALDAGIKEFVLWHESGITAYDTEEYNNISFEYQ